MRHEVEHTCCKSTGKRSSLLEGAPKSYRRLIAWSRTNFERDDQQKGERGWT